MESEPSSYIERMPPSVYTYMLKRLRKTAGLSQKGAARLLGVTPTQLMEWEKAKRFPHGYNLYKLSALYQTLIEALYPDMRLSAIGEVAENIKKYGPDGLGMLDDKPP
jgi:transcriptional regulator with XRE-family HTH domain